jgi:hypothetical protein
MKLMGVSKWVNLVGLGFQNVKGQMHVVCIFFKNLRVFWGQIAQVLCYEHGLGDKFKYWLLLLFGGFLGKVNMWYVCIVCMDGSKRARKRRIGI